MSTLLLIWAGEGLSLVLREAGTAGHLGSTRNIRVLGERQDPGAGEIFQRSCRKPGSLNSFGYSVGCPQTHSLGLQQGARDLKLPDLANKHVNAY